jgi:hypothetical protein
MRSVRFSRKLAIAAVLSAFLALVLVTLSLAQSGDAAGLPTLLNDAPATGVLTGNRAGAFAYYSIDYPGDLRVVTIGLQFAPADPVTRLGFGFNVYGPNGFVIGQGAEYENGDVEPLRLQYSDANKATWLVQVYNYIPGHRVDFSLLVGGLPELQAAPGPLPTPTVAPQPVSPRDLGLAAAGALVGNRSGAFAVYRLDYRGDGSEVALTMSFSPDDPVIARGVGFVVYGPSGEVAQGQSTGLPGQRRAVFSSRELGAYTVQVFNYIQGVVIQYSITR